MNLLKIKIGMFGRIKKKSRIGILAVSIFLFSGVVLAEPQFGGVVEHYMYCDCSDNYYLIVGDPHGGQYIQNNSTDLKDCQSPTIGQWVLGMHTTTTEDCEITVVDECVVFASGEVIEYFGASKLGGCDTGLDGDASGDGKTEMITPDGRKSDGDKDTHLFTSDDQDYEGSGNVHMQTPDHQNYEGGGTNHMTVDRRKYDGSYETVMNNSGSDSGYSNAGGGRPGWGYGSIGGSVGSLGLGAPGSSGSGGSGECPENCSATVAGMTAQCSGVANGGRPHFRFGSPGGTVCPGSCTVTIDCGGQSESYTITNGANRDNRGGFLWKPESESNGNLVILGPSSMVSNSDDESDSSSNSSDSSSSSKKSSSSNSSSDILSSDSLANSSNASAQNNSGNGGATGDNNSSNTNHVGATSQQSGNTASSQNNAALGTSLLSVIGGITDGKEMLRMLFVIASIGGAGYFVFKSMKKMLK
jgi:hypothetical protein